MDDGPVTYGFTLHLRVHDHTTRVWRCVGTAFGHFLVGSHNLMVTGLGSCVKWPHFSLFYHVWGPAWVEIPWTSIWLRARSHMASHYTWGSVTTLLNLEGVLRRPLDSFSWALPISWSRLLAHVWSGLECSLFYHVWGPARVEIPWTNIWLKAQSHIASHYTWGSVTTLLNLEGVLGWHLDTFSWALTIP